MNLLSKLKAKAEACSDATKESRARKGAYIDCIIMLQEAIESETKCPTCNAPAKMSYSGLDLVANTGDETLASKHYKFSI